MADASRVEILPVRGLPEIRPGAALAPLIVRALEEDGYLPAPCDVFVVTQKIVSKAEGQLVALDSVTPGEQAAAWARQHHKDARAVELVLREAQRIVRMEQGLIIAETRHGFVCANAGVDLSNVPPGMAALLPLDPDGSARELQAQLQHLLGVPLAVIISDTFGRPWRNGLVNVALGVAGMAPLTDYRGTPDAAGRKLQGTVMALADELAAAAELVMGKRDAVPVAIVRGLAYQPVPSSGRGLLRDAQDDLFR
jgi:coenzyme F420-0:L-glutamate ligase / coenzyme F420-1:gamma-L-glutamate ligase